MQTTIQVIVVFAGALVVLFGLLAYAKSRTAHRARFSYLWIAILTIIAITVGAGAFFGSRFFVPNLSVEVRVVVGVLVSLLPVLVVALSESLRAQGRRGLIVPQSRAATTSVDAKHDTE